MSAITKGFDELLEKVLNTLLEAKLECFLSYYIDLFEDEENELELLNYITHKFKGNIHKFSIKENVGFIEKFASFRLGEEAYSSQGEKEILEQLLDLVIDFKTNEM